MPSSRTLTDDDVAVLNTATGLKMLLAEPKIDLERALRLTRYELELRAMQAQLFTMQEWIIREGKRVVILFEGRDAAGKGGAIRRIAAHINPRHYRIVALDKPTAEERGQWYFQRYVNQLPKPGEIVFFDRSWYNRAVVEPVNGFCSDSEYVTFMTQVNGFEKMIVDSGTALIKIYFSISQEQQAVRFKAIKRDPRKRWKMTPVDERAQELWHEYTHYKEAMFEETDTGVCPWIVLDANRKSDARLEAIRLLLSAIPYQHDEPEAAQ